jgi:hypothetical protein
MKLNYVQALAVFKKFRKDIKRLDTKYNPQDLIQEVYGLTGNNTVKPIPTPKMTESPAVNRERMANYYKIINYQYYEAYKILFNIVKKAPYSKLYSEAQKTLKEDEKEEKEGAKEEEKLEDEKPKEAPLEEPTEKEYEDEETAEVDERGLAVIEIKDSAELAQEPLPELYATLAEIGITESTPPEVAKKKFREWLKKNHPDVLNNQGLTSSELEAATTKAQDIISAYFAYSSKNVRELHTKVVVNEGEGNKEIPEIFALPGTAIPYRPTSSKKDALSSLSLQKEKKGPSTAGTVGKKLAGKAVQAALAETGPVISRIAGRATEKVVDFVDKHKKEVVIGSVIVFGFASGANALALTGILALSFVLFWGSIAAILGSIIVFILAVFSSFAILIALILFIINSGAYVVPPGGFGPQQGGPGAIIPPPGGNVGSCIPADAGADITNQLAQRIQNGVVNLLPASNGAMVQNLCITPTMIILHSSSGYDNDNGNNAVYSTLVSRNLACQLASDTNDVYLMQHFYENQVQFAWCANSWNTYGVSIEISGECQDSGGRLCARNYSACQVGNDSYPYIFSDPPPHPCPNENDLTVSAVCEVMKQYHIPWTQIFTHDDVPNQSHTDPVGKAWVYNYFIPRVRNACPNP